MKNLNKTLLAVLGLTAFMAACADGPMAPESDVALAAAFGRGGNGGTDGDTQAASPTVLQWATPLAQDLTVSVDCRPASGCVLDIPEVGAQLQIPGATLSDPTVITMTALAGSDVNFEFGPHGTQFKKTVRIDVDQSKTKGMGVRKFWALYWVDNIEDVQEEIQASVKNGSIRFETDHFSGYAIAM